MRLFHLNEQYEVLPEQETVMLVPEFKNLWELNYNKQTGDAQGRQRTRGKAELAYLYFYCDYRSEFSELTNSERKEEALNASGLDPNYKISETLLTAQKKYLKMQETRELKLLTSAYGVIDKLQIYFDAVEIRDGNSKSVIENLSKLGNVLNGLKKLEEQVRKQQRSDGKIRGDQEKGFLD